MYVCLGPLKKAFFESCRKIVGLDGCHLKGPYGGQLLAAVGIDASEGMYPVAWAVVEVENTDSWTWFLQFLCQDIKILIDREWTFISDRQKGLINALETVVPQAEHRFCVMHLFQNMHKEHKGISLRHLLWKAARASTIWEFNLHMNEIKEISPKCYDWLMQKPREQWSRSAFRTTSSSDMFVNNHCEVFNSSIRKFRDLPILTMFRQIHIAIMRRIQIRRDKMKDRELVICPSAQKKLNKAVQWAGNCVVNWSGGSTYSVTTTDGGHELVVDLVKKTCTCRKWELTGIPCYHACACIALRNETWDHYISEWYKKEMYFKLYNTTLDPIVGPDFWEDTPEPKPLPPNVKIPTGRPKKKRNTTNDVPKDPTKMSRKNTVVHCNYCKAQGHNWRSCVARKNDDKKKAEAEGKEFTEGKTKVKCKNCGKEGHNSRTCKVPKQVPNWHRVETEQPHEVFHNESTETQQAQGEGPSNSRPNRAKRSAQGQERSPMGQTEGRGFTTLKGLKASKRVKKTQVQAEQSAKKKPWKP
ncbi:uncharacterized protein LOC141717097 [Apium graveolens]|uniref:uncharacterized protein LOC141717097 n=1 Tax=Apium graveolens TaxID=4045 RepID=UPI003D78ECE4